MAFTADQRRAIDARGANLLVSAAAGSGKTTVLVERVLALLNEKADVRRMLIITFTRASAADMREALMRRLNAANMYEQAERAERAQISTIHSFLTELLRAHFQAADVDPAFRILDNAESEQLFSKALENALEAAYSGPTPDHALLVSERGTAEVAELTRALYGFVMQRRDPRGWLQGAIEKLEAGEPAWEEELRRAALRYVKEAEALSDRALEICALSEGPAAYSPALEADVAALEAARSLAYPALRAALADFSFVKLKAARGGDAALKDEVKALRDRAKRAVKRAASLLPGEGALEDARLSAPSLRALRDIALALDAEYSRLKAARRALTFADLEHRALGVLADKNAREEVRARYDYVFVDEYQDVSDAQDAIVEAVARPGRLFMVGDVKQSIYRFRQAEPSLFMDKYARYGANDGGNLISLNVNFRARPELLDFVNRVFERTMVGGASEIVYDDGARLRAGGSFEGAGEPVLARILVAGDDAEKGDIGEEEQLIEDLREAEAESVVVAAQAAELIGRAFYDARAGRERPIEPRDICVLLRQAKDTSQVMLEALAKAGVPAYADISGGFSQAWEVRLLLALAALTRNRRLDLNWIAFLRSPIGGLTSDELASIRLTQPKGPYCEAVFARMKLDDPLAKRIKRLNALLERWRALERGLPLASLLFAMARETGMMEFIGALSGGARRQNNVYALCERATAYERAQGGGLGGFLEYMERVSAAREDMGEAHSLADENVVRVMTVHKSKGLEFPVVIAAQLGRGFRGDARAGELVCHRQLGVGMQYCDPQLGTRRDTLARSAILSARRREALAEELRILYVLLTRAKDRLILIGSAKSEAAVRFAAEGLSEPGSMLDILAPALMAGAAVETRFEGRSAEGWRATSERKRCEERLDEALSGAAEDKYLRALSWRYPHEGDAYVPLKLTASGAARELTGPAVYLEAPRRPEFAKESGMSATERGTAVHDVMRALELAPLAGLSGEALLSELEAQYKRLLAKGRVAEGAPWRTLRRFFEGELGRRLLASREVRREWMFVMAIPASEATEGGGAESILVQGSVDCCFEEGGKWVLLDYKTDRASDVAALTEAYGPQLRLYKRALEKLTGREVAETRLCLLSAGLAPKVYV